MKKVKLIWDFFGTDAQKTAEHHCVHLEEFAKKENIETAFSGTESPGENQVSAYLVVPESHLLSVRDALKPRRGEWWQD